MMAKLLHLRMAIASNATARTAQATTYQADFAHLQNIAKHPACPFDTYKRSNAITVHLHDATVA